MEYSHEEMLTPACDTVTVCPPMTTEPVRSVPGLEATLTVTVPAPLPLFPVSTDIQADVLDACHEHPLGALTVTVTVAPAADNSMLDVSTPKLQGAAA